MGPHDRVGTYTAWAFGHPRKTVIELLEQARSSGLQRKAVSEQVATGVTRFEEHQVTAPIFATGWDGNVRVTMFADGRSAPHGNALDSAASKRAHSVQRSNRQAGRT